MPLSSLEERIVRELAGRGGALVEDLRLHVGIATGPGCRAGLDETRERLTARLAALGARVTLVPGDPAPEWLYGARAGAEPPPTAVARRVDAASGGARRILLSGHMDTVHDPASGFDRLAVAADGVRATGPGCVDMKGGLVVALAALEALEAAGAPVSWSFVLNSDEETGSYHSDRALREEASRHDVGLVFEPALPDGGLAVERPGSGQFMIECVGKAAHTGRDFAAGVSAVNALAERLVRIAGMSDAARGRVVSVGPIEGGHAPNIVPDRARAWGNVRYRDEAVAAEIGRELDALAASGMPAARVVRSFNRPAKPMTAEVERLAHAARGVSEDLGRPMPFGRTGGVCDGNNLQSAGLATIDTLGPRGGGLHTPEEWIELPSLVERAQLAAVLMLRLGGVG